MSEAVTLKTLHNANIKPAAANRAHLARVSSVPLVLKNEVVIAAAAHHRVRGDASADDLVDD